MIPSGKGMYIWQIPRCGSPRDIAAQAKAAGFGHVLIKIADGDYPFPDTNDNVAELVAELKKVGIESWGWQFIYLYSPQGEAAIAAKRMKETGCVGFIIDAEGRCKNKPLQASDYCRNLRELLPNTPIGLASYRYPSLHPELPWKIFRAICSFDMPQVYWQGAHNPGWQLAASYAEFSKMIPALPYVPTGAAYSEYDWVVFPADIDEFIDVANQMGFQAYNFWEWYEARIENPELWPHIADAGIIEPIIADTMQFEALVDGQNVRSGPGYAYPIIGNLIDGQVLDVSNVKGYDAWAEIAPGQWAAIFASGRQFLKKV